MLEILDKLKESPDIYEEFHKSILDKSYNAKVITFVNPYSYLLLRNKVDLLKSIDGLYSDAITSSKIFTYLFKRSIPRISFDQSSFAKHFLEQANQHKLKVFLVGAKSTELEKTVAIFKSTYPNMQLVGYRDGYFSNDQDVIEVISQSGAEYVICGMGTPRQDEFALKVKELSNGSIKQIYTCGGFLHQSSERLEYYPKLIDKLHLRWLYRAFDSSYVLKRLVFEYPKFFFVVFADFRKEQN